jgi:hypothetical protein
VQKSLWKRSLRLPQKKAPPKGEAKPFNKGRRVPATGCLKFKPIRSEIQQEIKILQSGPGGLNCLNVSSSYRRKCLNTNIKSGSKYFKKFLTTFP